MSHPKGIIHRRIRMRQALGLAKRGEGRSGSNPSVGCIIEGDDGHIIASGATACGGRPHAEVIALQRARGKTYGTTLYSTLEPCCHHGKTPPCTDAIIAAQIGCVIIGCPDPDPRVNRQGIAQLRGAGIKVIDDIAFTEVDDFYTGYTHNRRHGRPSFTLKMALSLDGRSRTPEKNQRRISGLTSHRFVHRLRSQYDAIMVGANTLKFDNPLLTYRAPFSPTHKSSVVLLDRKLDALRNHINNNHFKVFQQTLHRCITICYDCTYESTWQHLHESYKDKFSDSDIPLLVGIPVPIVKNRLDLVMLAGTLAKNGINNVLVEGGAELGSALLDACLLDRCYTIIAPKFFGANCHPGIGVLAKGQPWHFRSVRRLGADYLLETRPSCLQD